MDSEQRKEKKRDLYGNKHYRKQSKWVRDTAEKCWICGAGPRPGDPWQADHLIPGNTDSELLATHRSCNAKRGNKSYEQILAERGTPPVAFNREWGKS